MKRYLIICLAAAVAVLGTASCGEIESSGKEGSLTITILDDLDAAATKASDKTELTYEKQINKIDFFLFQGNVLYEHLTLSSSDVATLPYTRSYPKVPVGSYTIYAVANGPASLSTATEKTAVTGAVISLADCSTTASTGFVMYGTASATVENGGSATVSLKMSRYASRVRLTKVTNGLANGTAISVTAVYLANVWGKWTLAGATSASTVGTDTGLNEWVNLAARAAGKNASTTASDFIKAASAVNPSAYAAQVFKAVPSADRSIAAGTAGAKTYNYALYAFPSTVTEDHTGPIADADKDKGALPRLVIVATVNGTVYYYPITLTAKLVRNYTYDVSVTITGSGSTDPNEPVQRGALSASVNVNPWTAGNEYTETI